jgi:hypothetical protein
VRRIGYSSIAALISLPPFGGLILPGKTRDSRTNDTMVVMWSLRSWIFWTTLNYGTKKTSFSSAGVSVPVLASQAVYVTSKYQNG